VQLLMGLFLLSFTAVAIAQQYGPSSNLPDLSDGLLRPSIEETTAQTGTTTSDSARTLPDAPSHTARPTASEATRSAADMTNFRPSGAGTAPSLATSSTRYLNFSASNSGGSGSLIFTGGNATTADSVDARSGTSGPGASCGRTSVDKSNGSDWINSILAITSHKGGRYCALGEGRTPQPVPSSPTGTTAIPSMLRSSWDPAMHPRCRAATMRTPTTRVSD